MVFQGLFLPSFEPSAVQGLSFYMVDSEEKKKNAVMKIIFT